MALDLVTTNAGRAEILQALQQQKTITVQDVQVSTTSQVITVTTTALTNPKATLPVAGSVRNTGAGFVLRVVITDASNVAYDLRALVLRLSGGVILMGYGQDTPIARKAAESSLTLSLDLSIDDQTAATVTFGNTDFALPAATENLPGVVRLATATEAKQLNSDRAISSKGLASALGASAMHRVWVPPHAVSPGTTFQLRQDNRGLRVQRGSVGATGAELRWALPTIPKRSRITRAFMMFRATWANQVQAFQLRFSVRTLRYLAVATPPEGFTQNAVSPIFQGGGNNLPTPLEQVLQVDVGAGLDMPDAPGEGTPTFTGLEAVAEVTSVTFGGGNTIDSDFFVVYGFALEYTAPTSAPFVN